MPLVYSIGSALTLLYLARKPVHLDQYEPLKDEDDLAPESDVPEPSHHQEPASASAVEPATVDNLQSQYQAQRNSGMSINLARLGLTFLQLGLSLSAILLAHRSAHEDQTGRRSRLDETAQILTWLYALALTFVHVVRPIVSSQFWIRPQLDILYGLQFVLSSIHLYRTNIFVLPIAEWPFWLKLDDLAWLLNLALIWISLVSRPYNPPTPTKKLSDGEVARLASSEYSSSMFSQLTFAWVNPLVYLGYKRSLQDVDLPSLENSDYSYYSLRHFRMFA